MHADRTATSKALAVSLVGLALAMLPAATRAASNCGGSVSNIFWESLPGSSPATGICFSAGFLCKAPKPGEYFFRVGNPPCDPNTTACQIQVYVPWEFPGNVQDTSSINPNVCWYPTATAPAADRLDPSCGNAIAICGSLGNEILSDFAGTFAALGLYSCATLDQLSGAYSQNAFNCRSNGSCFKRVPLNDILLSGGKAKADVGCKIPPPSSCGETPNDPAGASGASCTQCEPMAGPGGCSTGVEGKSLSCTPSGSGPNTFLHFRHLGPGTTGLPGHLAWRTNLGQSWSHDYAQRIVVDPDSSHVWLITGRGSFREFKSLAGGAGLRLYQQVSPTDEFRRLYLDDGDGNGVGPWRLVSLDGRTDYFHESGLWDKATFANDVNVLDASYDGGTGYLSTVALRDGRKEKFLYHPSGRLWKIQEEGVGASPPIREWVFLWSNSNAGDELVNIARPDGTSFELSYDPTSKYLTQIFQVGTDLSGRIVARFEYDTAGNVTKSWRGALNFGDAGAVDKRTFTYTNPTLPTKTVVVDGIGNQTEYVLGRDQGGIKAKVLSRTGSCPSCGLPPKVTFEYDPARPLLLTAMLDARTPAVRTEYTYDVNGRRTSMREAVGVSGLERTTEWIYHPTAPFQGVVTEVKRPSTNTGAGNFRRLIMTVDPTSGNVNPRTIAGFETGQPGGTFSLDTTFLYNTSGEPTSIDPPGSGDTVGLTYDLARGNHVLATRTDPLVGTTSFGYDPFNQRTTVTDPNLVVTSTAYDTNGAVTLSRVKEIRQLGSVPADDLVTTYAYNVFGDLFCTKLPMGNGIQYVYDTPGRIKEVIRGTAVSTPSPTSCLDSAFARERTVYELDSQGNRTAEDLQKAAAGGAFGATESRTTYTYTCHLDKVIQGQGSGNESVTSYCYDVNDNLEKVWDPNHPQVSNPSSPSQLYEYDELNRIEKVTIGVGTTNASTSYTYDVQDHLASVTDAESNLTTYQTSDRDLMTQEVSPVSGTTTYVYDARGDLEKVTDARAMVTTRTLDAASRVTQETFGPSGSPDPALTITYAYGSTPAQFDVGRLTGITRDGQTVGYTYDRFGRLLQDGALAYEHDKNGNRKKITYPGGVVAEYAFDALNRPTGLTYDTGSGAQTLVSNVSYRALGPLEELTLGNGLVETRAFDNRNFVDAIQAGTLLDWDYTLDAVGNPTAIVGTVNGVSFNPTFDYHDDLYFLTSGDGPWGTRDFTYDKIGNRLTLVRQSEPTQTYGYSGNNPKLQTVTPAPGWGTGSWSFTYDAAGNQTQLLESNGEGAQQTTFFDAAADGRISALRTSTGPTQTDMLYDGRGFLRQAHAAVSPPGDFITNLPVYSSEGMLYALTEQRRWSGGSGGNGEDDPTVVSITADTTQLFYFAGRPVAQLTNQSELLYLTTDHLGTPVLATGGTQGVVWAGALEPFGTTWTAGADRPDDGFSIFGPDSSSQRQHAGRGGPGVFGLLGSPSVSKLGHNKVFLRYPGQWVSDAFRVTGTQQEIYYNVHRWYQPQTGRYTQLDPLDQAGGYLYASGSPALLIDPTGEDPREPEPPWHPDEHVKTACKPMDDCATIKEKMFNLIIMIRTHQRWDWTVPRPRGGNRHARDLEQLWKQYADCQALYIAKCDKPGPIERCLRRIGDGVWRVIEWMADHPPGRVVPLPPLPLPLPVPVP